MSLGKESLNVISNLKNLKFLTIRDIGLYDEHIKNFENLENIEFLDIGNTLITSSGLLNLKSLKSLKTIICDNVSLDYNILYPLSNNSLALTSICYARTSLNEYEFATNQSQFYYLQFMNLFLTPKDFLKIQNIVKKYGSNIDFEKYFSIVFSVFTEKDEYKYIFKKSNYLKILELLDGCF